MLSSGKFTYRHSVFLLFLTFFVFNPQHGYCLEKKKNFFPEFQFIADNVAFWEKVYKDFSINTAVLHDKDDLSIIYETSPLLDRSLPGATRLNRTYLKTLRNKYIAVLQKLADGKQPESTAEKRVYRLFSQPNIRIKLRKASQNIRIQTGLKERFIEGVIRSGGYIEEMKKIFESYGLPPDLAYLPHVESSFNIKAYSKFGAAGMWQFTHSTGKRFMTIDHTLDERRDPLIATRAAALYLKYNYKNLGTWPLAITAYNYGHAGMQRALKQEGNYQNIYKNYKKGHFKFASRNFYAEFLAARNVARELENNPTLKRNKAGRNFTLTLKGYAAANDLLQHLQLNKKVLEELNPALRPSVWQGEKYIPKGYRLRLPHTPQLLVLARNIPEELFSSIQKRSMYYRVQRGDTAGYIARKFGVSLSRLSNANNLNKNSVVRIGQSLRIPSPQSSTTDYTAGAVRPASSGNSGSVTVLQQVKKSLPIWQISSSREVSPNSDLHIIRTGVSNGIQFGEITVEPEESLGLYSEWLKISQQHLHTFNGLSKGSALRPGQKLKVPLSSVSLQDFEAKRLDFHQETEEDFFSSYKITGFLKYKVTLGDTLWDLCQNKFDLPLWLLKKYNRDLQYNALSRDQRLHIPVIESL